MDNEVTESNGRTERVNKMIQAHHDECKLRKASFLEKLVETNGFTGRACKAAGISRTTYTRWLREDTEFAEAVQAFVEGLKDKAEAKLQEHIDNDDLTATIFFLKTKCKDRGYTEKSEVSATIDTNINFEY